MKKILSGKPSILISKGKIDQRELENARISVEELLSELRLKGVFDPEEVYYAMLEPNGQISILTNALDTPLTPRDINAEVKEYGIARAVIVDGHIKSDSLDALQITEKEIRKYLNKNHSDINDVFMMTVDDAMRINVVYKKERKNNK